MKIIDVLGFIASFSYWDDTISPRTIAKQLKEANGESVHLRINSPGGDAFAGIAVYNQLKAYDGDVTVEVIGLAASAASIIALGGDKLTVKRGAMLMIHEPIAFTIGDASRHESTAASLRKLIDSLVDVYVSESSNDLDKEDIKQEMADETWYTAQEAVDKGWAAEVVESKDTDDDKDTKKNVRQALTSVRNLWYNSDRIPDQLAALMQPSAESETTEDTQDVDKADEKRISQLEDQVKSLTAEVEKGKTALAEKNNAIAALVEQNKDLKTSSAKAEKAALDAKVNAKLDEAQSEGRLAKSDRAKWDKRLRKDFYTFAEILDDMPKLVNAGSASGEDASDSADGADSGLDAAVNKVVVQSMRESGYSEKAIKAALASTDDILGEGGDIVDDEDDDSEGDE